MSRALTVQRATIPAKDRARFLEQVQACAAHYKAAGCRYWIFEDIKFAGAFVEFVEADTLEQLADACESAPERERDRARQVYQQVEI